jgi:D-serine deaminase-like pyridoxal phosphate-dependent protein
VLHDARSEEQNGDLGLVPAAWVVSRVVSRPAAGVVTCDAGSKALAAEAGDPCAVVAGHPELVALPPSEEHLPLRVTTGGGPARGEALALVPRHVCPTVNLAEEALLRDGDELRVVPVRARAHDLAERAGS